MLLIDLTHTMTNGMPVFPGSIPVSLNTASRLGSEGYNEIRINITTHTGTHIDCGKHLIADSFDTLSASADRFFGEGLVIDCRTTEDIIPLSLFRQLEQAIKSHDFILLHTGWSKYWGEPGYFRNFPTLSPEAVEFLLQHNFKGIGIDAPSFDPVGSVELPVHIKLLSHGKVLIENLTHLEDLPPKNFLFSCLPLKIQDGDGSPVRAVGIVEERGEWGVGSREWGVGSRE